MKTKECPNCRALLVQASTVCGRCGTSFASSVPPAAVPVPPWLADLADPPGEADTGPGQASAAPGRPSPPPPSPPPPPGQSEAFGFATPDPTPPGHPPPDSGGPGPGGAGYGGSGYGGPGYGGPGYPPPGFGPGGYPSGSPVRQTHPQATTALVLGILSLVVCGLFTAIPAIVVGNRVRREIRASGGALEGEGSARAGVVCGWVSVAFTAVGVLAFIALVMIGTTVDTQPGFAPGVESELDSPYESELDVPAPPVDDRAPRVNEFPPTTR